MEFARRSRMSLMFSEIGRPEPLTPSARRVSVRSSRGSRPPRSRAITIEMLIAAAEAIARLAEPGEVVPSPLNHEVHEAVRRASAQCARDLGLENTGRAK